MTQLFIRFLNVSIAVSWLVPVILLLRLLLKKAPKWVLCLLWAVVALRLIMPFSIESKFSLLPSAEVIPRDIATTQSPAIYSGIPAVNSTVNPILDTHFTQKGSTPAPILSVCAQIWVAGMGILLLYSLFTYLRIRLQVRASMRYKDNIYLCDDIDSPFILGTVRPRIYVPSDMDEAQLSYVLAHEKAHIRRRDHWWKPLGYVLLSVYWCNPLLWVAYILLCRDIEQACDEKVISQMDTAEKKGYSEALLACSVHRRMVTACPVAFGEVSVKTRIKNIVSYKKPGFWIILVSLVACTVTAVCFLTDPKPCEHMDHGVITAYPTCTEDGVETYTCGLCQHRYEAPIPMLEHTYDDGVVIHAPTCIREGVLEYTCTDCGDKEQETLERTAHTPGALTVSEKSNCVRQGEQTSYCTLCRAVCAVEIMAVNDAHDLIPIVSLEPTCTEDGAYSLNCTRCSYTEPHTIEKTGHHLVATGVIEATCRQGAWQNLKCTECPLVTYTVISEPLSRSQCSCTNCNLSFSTSSRGNSSGIELPSFMPEAPGPIWWDPVSNPNKPNRPVGPQPIFP